MHTRRFAALLLGGWLAGSLFMMFAATQNFAAVDRLVERPPEALQGSLEKLGPDGARQLLRFQASDMNRLLFERWGLAQFGLALAVFLASVFTPHRSTVLLTLSFFMLLIAGLQTLYLSPSMNALSRMFDFLPKTDALAQREMFRQMHIGYAVSEVIKLILGVFLALRLLFDRASWRRKLAIDAGDSDEIGRLNGGRERLPPPARGSRRG